MKDANRGHCSPSVGVLKRRFDSGSHLGDVETPDFDSVVHAGCEEKVTWQRDVSVQHLRSMTFHTTEDTYNDVRGDIPQAYGKVFTRKDEQKIKREKGTLRTF